MRDLVTDILTYLHGEAPLLTSCHKSRGHPSDQFYIELNLLLTRILDKNWRQRAFSPPQFVLKIFIKKNSTHPNHVQGGGHAG